MVRVCPERDAQCPHGQYCPYAFDSYSCKPGWRASNPRTSKMTDDKVKEAVEPSRYHLTEPTILLHTAEGARSFGEGWLLISEDEYAKLSAEVERLKPTRSTNDHLHSVVYRHGPPAVQDYDEAIADLQNAREALLTGDSMGCRVCEDSGHGADMCHHNPLLLARKWASASRFWQCWHCGYVATSDAEGREHFGDHDGEPPSCIKAELIARVETAEAKLTALVEAAKPIAVAYKIQPPDKDNWPDDRPAREWLPGGWPTTGDFRRLIAALSDAPPTTPTSAPVEDGGGLHPDTVNTLKSLAEDFELGARMPIKITRGDTGQPLHDMGAIAADFRRILAALSPSLIQPQGEERS